MQKKSAKRCRFFVMRDISSNFEVGVRGLKAKSHTILGMAATLLARADAS